MSQILCMILIIFFLILKSPHLFSIELDVSLFPGYICPDAIIFCPHEVFRPDKLFFERNIEPAKEVFYENICWNRYSFKQ